MADSEVITMEVAGEFLGVDTDVGIWTYLGRHWRSWFPELGSRTTFAQQAANRWVVKQRLHQQCLIDLGAATDSMRRVDGCPLPVCGLTRAPQCRRFPGIADWGYCAAKKQDDHGLHGHRMITFDGVITACTVTPASGDEREALWALTEGVRGLLIGDKGSMSAFLQAELATVGIDLQTPLRVNRTDSRPPGSSSNSRAPAASWKRSSVNWPSSFILRKSGRVRLRRALRRRFPFYALKGIGRPLGA